MIAVSLVLLVAAAQGAPVERAGGSRGTELAQEIGRSHSRDGACKFRGDLFRYNEYRLAPALNAHARSIKFASVIGEHVAFIDIPKAGSTNIRRSLRAQSGFTEYGFMDHKGIVENEEHFAELIQNKFVFTFVREPLARLESGLRTVLNRCPEARNGFQDFFFEHYALESHRVYHHIFPQCYFMSWLNGTMLPFDFVGRIENMVEDLAELNSILRSRFNIEISAEANAENLHKLPRTFTNTREGAAYSEQSAAYLKEWQSSLPHIFKSEYGCDMECVSADPKH